MQSERNKSSDARAEKKALLHSLPSQVAAARAEQGTEQARLETGVIVRCAICHVDIDEVTANGCGISLERCNLDEVRSRIALAEQQIKELERQQLALPAEIDKLDREILRLDREIAQIDGSFAQLEQQMSATNMAVNRASELVRETTWFDLQLKDRVGIAQRLALIDKN